MAHEHNGECCTLQEQLEHEHAHHVIEQLGSLCCSGGCHHPEHQFIRDQIEQHHLYESVNETATVIAPVEKKLPEKKTKKKDKKKYATLFGQLLAKVA